ncbi:hypothetical protein NKR23_g8936 [Pleurostoma richardsiae]|uniref:Uncharacterized protein n=1 Tax=Pleurostoma richardsiae TaxID=41990 RepID=A0AA38RP51_9PEZI|nr:hypothetical protein NKR23_g8936 [Pleurostoma richardsiae]
MARQYRRLYPFKGTELEYIIYLENELRSLRSHATALEAKLAAHGSQTAADVELTSDPIFEVSTPETLKAEVEKRGTPAIPPKWEAATSDFLSRLPTSGAKWLQTRSDARLSTPKQIIDSFHILTLNRCRISSSYPAAQSTAHPLKVVDAYGHLVGLLQVDAQFSKQLHNYSQLLFFCVCHVARSNGFSVEDVDTLVATCLPERDASSKYLSRLRTAASWVAQLIDKLEPTLGYLSPACFLLCGPAIETYREYTTWAKTAEYLVEQIKKRTKSLQDDPPDEVRVSFSPTFLITYVGPWSLDQVNKALGTSLSQEDYASRLRIVRETEDLVREPGANGGEGEIGQRYAQVRRTETRQDPSPSESTTACGMDAELSSLDESSTGQFQSINAGKHGRDDPTATVLDRYNMVRVRFPIFQRTAWKAIWHPSR